MEDAILGFIKDHWLGVIIGETIVIAILVFLLVICYQELKRQSLSQRAHKHYSPRTTTASHSNQSRSQAAASTPHKCDVGQIQQMQSFRETKPATGNSELVDNKVVQEKKPQINYNYLQEANGGKFLRQFPTPDKCFFRTWEIDGTRKYEFCGNVAKALANINAIFDDVCEIEGKRHGATDIENVSAGTLDSELRITSKAKIRLK